MNLLICNNDKIPMSISSCYVSCTRQFTFPLSVSISFWFLVWCMTFQAVFPNSDNSPFPGVYEN
jgi:hypothetical protein